MSFAESLKEQIGSYLHYLGIYEAALPEVMELLHGAAETAKKRRDERAEKTQAEIVAVSLRLGQIVEMKKELINLSGSVRASIDEYLRYMRTVRSYHSKGKQKQLLEEYKTRIEQNEEKTQQLYGKLVALRKKYAEVIGESMANADLDGEKITGDQLAELQKKQKAQEADRAYCKLLSHIKGEDKGKIEKFLSVLPFVCICNNYMLANEYPDLLRLFALYTRRRETAQLAPNLAVGSVSIVCSELFDDLRMQIISQNDILINHCAEEAFTVKMLRGFELNYSGDRAEFELALPKACGIRQILLFSRDELQRILDELESHPAADLPGLAEILYGPRNGEAAKYLESVGALRPRAKDPNVEKFEKDLAEFKRLYRETPEERLLTEQRYYQQKLLSEAEIKNMLLQRQLEEQSQFQEEQRRAQRRAEARQQEEARRAYEQQARQRREDEERRRQAEMDERMATRKQCGSCARYSSCRLQRPNCASYVPR